MYVVFRVVAPYILSAHKQTMRSSEILLTTYKTARLHNPEDHIRRLHREYLTHISDIST